MLPLKNIVSGFGSSPIPTLILEPDEPFFFIVGFNEAFLKTSGRAPKQLAGKEIVKAFQDCFENVESKEKIKYSLEYVLFHRTWHKTFLLKCNSSIHERSGWHCESYPILKIDGSVQFIVQQLIEVKEKIRP